MAWPEGVSTVDVAWSRGYSAEGTRVDVTARIRAIMPGAQYLVHSPTGARLVPLTSQHRASDAEQVFKLPAVDAPGWVDETGAEYNGWSYEVVLRYLHLNKAQSVTHNFQVFTGEPLLDLDEITQEEIGSPKVVTRYPVKSVGGVFPDATGNVPLSGGGVGDLALQEHINSLTPHPVYDNGEDLALFFENGLN